jgi:hypothetical protein
VLPELGAGGCCLLLTIGALCEERGGAVPFSECGRGSEQARSACGPAFLEGEPGEAFQARGEPRPVRCLAAGRECLEEELLRRFVVALVLGDEPVLASRVGMPQASPSRR